MSLFRLVFLLVWLVFMLDCLVLKLVYCMVWEWNVDGFYLRIMVKLCACI